MGASKTVRCLFLLVSVVITAIVVVVATPERIPELKPLGDAAVNSTPSIRISLAFMHMSKSGWTRPQKFSQA